MKLNKLLTKCGALSSLPPPCSRRGENCRTICWGKSTPPINQICSLERSVKRTGRDEITHPVQGQDDCGNAIAGTASLAYSSYQAFDQTWAWVDGTPIGAKNDGSQSWHEPRTSRSLAEGLSFDRRCSTRRRLFMAQYDDDETFENGVLRDGARYRVPMQMRDSGTPMITDGSGSTLGLQRPGWRIPSGGSERHVRLRDDQRRQIEEAHAEYVDHLTNAWKGNRSTEASGRR
jgi:hypothetical protein